MTALTFQPNGDRIDALQVDGTKVGEVRIFPTYCTGRLFNLSPWPIYPICAIAAGNADHCKRAIVAAWAKRFPHA